MNIISITRDYIVWHYSIAISDIFNIWVNYLWFVNHLFSVPQVIMSWFAPFKRLQEDRGNFLMHPEEFFSGLFINIIMRLVGFMLRTAIILMALSGFLTVFIGGVMFLGLWIALPYLVVSFFFNGIGSFFL